MNRNFKLFTAAALALSLSACQVYKNNEVTGVPSNDELHAMVFERHNSRIVSIKSGSQITSILQTFTNSGVPILVSKDMDIRGLRYTGPDIDSMNAMDALQVVFGTTVLDYQVNPRSGLLTVVPSRYYQHYLSAQMTSEDWQSLLSSADVIATASYTDKSGAVRSINLGAILDDRNSNSIRVAAPLHTRKKISELIATYGEQLKDPHVIGVVRKAGGISLPSRINPQAVKDEAPAGDNVQIGTLAPRSNFE